MQSEMECLTVCLQVERRVVNQLAAAYEEGVVSRGSTVRLVVEGEGEKVGLVVGKGARNKRVSLATVSSGYHGNHVLL